MINQFLYKFKKKIQENKTSIFKPITAPIICASYILLGEVLLRFQL